MNLTERFAIFFIRVPAKRRASDTCGQMIKPSFLVMLRDDEVFQDIVQKKCKGRTAVMLVLLPRILFMNMPVQLSYWNRFEYLCQRY